MKRTLTAGGVYLALAALGHAREHSGSATCECRPECWCKRPGLSVFRWVFPFGHRTGVSSPMSNAPGDGPAQAPLGERRTT
jgi:hypothetical protein